MDSKNKSLLWVGISMQKDSLIPLDEKFVSGRLISSVIELMPEYCHHKANLVNFAPLDKLGKIRYPLKSEIDDSFPFLNDLIEVVRPQIIIALGGVVIKSLSEAFDMKLELPKGFEYQVVAGKFSIMPVQHPSYISIYKKKHIDDYRNGIVNGVKNLFLDI